MVYTTLIPVIVGSGDQNAYPSSTVSDFTVELADALLLQGRWQCRCDSVSFAKPNYKSVAPTFKSIIVTMPGVLDGSIIGSTKLPLLFRTGPMMETNVTQRCIFSQDMMIGAGESTVSRFAGTDHMSPLPIWRDVQPSILNTLRLTCTQINGVALPETDPTAAIGNKQNFTTVSPYSEKLAVENKYNVYPCKRVVPCLPRSVHQQRSVRPSPKHRRRRRRRRPRSAVEPFGRPHWPQAVLQR